MNPVRYLATIVLFLAALVACTTPQVKSPQDAINEANVTLTAVANVIAQNVKDGIFTKDEAQKYLDQVKDLARKVDTAQALIRAGDPKGAEQAELLRTLIVALHREVAARAR